jgi:hypothetical protein
MTSPWLEFDLSLDPLKFIFSGAMPPPRIRPGNRVIYSGAVRIFSVGSSFRNAPPLSAEFLIGERHPLWGCNSIPTWLSACVGKLFVSSIENLLSVHRTRARPIPSVPVQAMATRARQYPRQICPAATAFPSTSD